MLRAPPTPQFSDALNLDGLGENLPVIAAAGATTTFLPPTAAPAPFSHPILGVHIENYIKFQVNTSRANFSK
jgi:hypothetical protein